MRPFLRVGVASRDARAASMNEAVPMASPVPSPCTSVCRMDERAGWCEGCLRTLDEIVAWGTMADDAKRNVWLRLQERRDTTHPTNERLR